VGDSRIGKSPFPVVSGNKKALSATQVNRNVTDAAANTFDLIRTSSQYIVAINNQNMAKNKNIADMACDVIPLLNICLASGGSNINGGTPKKITKQIEKIIKL
jgi:hypothetical protein